MICQTATLILRSLKNRVSISVNNEDITELPEIGAISIYNPTRDLDIVEKEIKGIVVEFDQFSDEIRDLYRDQAQKEKELRDSGMLASLLLFAGIGKASTIKKSIRIEKERLQQKTVRLTELKDQILNLTKEREKITGGVRTNGKVVG